MLVVLEYRILSLLSLHSNCFLKIFLKAYIYLNQVFKLIYCPIL